MRSLFFVLLLMGSCAHPALSQGAFPLRPSDKAAPSGIPEEDPADRNVSGNSPQQAAESEVADGASAAEPSSDEVAEFVIASGDNLTKVSLDAYGRRGYWRVLKLFNEADPNKLKVGQVIKAPEFSWLMKSENVVPLMQDAVDNLIAGRRSYLEVEEKLRERVEDSGDLALSEEELTQLKESQKRIALAQQQFADEREGVKAVPSSTILQLRTVADLIGKVAQGTGDPAANMTMVHEHLGNAITYCVLWARDGFK